ncbi:hypothetical protein [Burkholderia sp. AU19243]|uniref:hypothetical protein n=1 Tax=Burkholderia sp. AU19243 TaxID=2824810 RepID=UPI002012D9CB|nr:hypothetical protein [Burkholderia sp. AU19243]
MAWWIPFACGRGLYEDVISPQSPDSARCSTSEAPGKAGIAMSFAHGQGNAGPCNEHFGYDHQGSYGDAYGRSLYATMYAIVKIAQKARWHKKESA